MADSCECSFCNQAATFQCANCAVPMCNVHGRDYHRSEQHGHVVTTWRKRICSHCYTLYSFIDAEEKKLQWASMLFCVPCLCIYIGLTWTDRVDQKFAEYNAVHDPPTVIRITRGKYDGCIYPHSHPEFARQQMMFAQQDEHAEEEDDDDDDLVPLVDQQ